MKRIKIYIFIFALAAIVCFTKTFSYAAEQTVEKAVSAKHAKKKKANKAASKRAVKKKVKIEKAMNQTNTSAVESGAWGATGLALTVTNAGALLEYDCASGEITERLIVDAAGNFKAGGTYLRRSPGPIRIGFEPKSQPATYEGKITGETMTLKVILTESGKLAGEHTLKKGVTPRLHKCY